MNDEKTQAQVAAVLLQNGTAAQVGEALSWLNVNARQCQRTAFVRPARIDATDFRPNAPRNTIVVDGWILPPEGSEVAWTSTWDTLHTQGLIEVS